MTRLRADFLLVIVTLIWGTAFIAQKIGMDVMGPYLFVGLRMAISGIVLIPFAWIEARRKQAEPEQGVILNKWMLLFLSVAFTGGVIAQQAGIALTSVTNSGFLTTLYVLFTPIIAWGIFKMTPNKIVWLAGPLSLLGVYLLGDASFTKLTSGDLLVVLCALFFGFHIVLIGVVVQQSKAPYMIACVQFFFCSVVGFIMALYFEAIDISAIYQAMPALLYTGLLSGGIAYTLQIIAQQYTPASDAAVIISGEALVAAIAGALLLGDRLTPLAWGGCTCIFAAVLLVELWPFFKKSIRRKMTQESG